jgi:hypothetical protein
MATSGIRKRVSRRTGRLSYQVWWRMEDGGQGARTVSSRDEARELLDEKRLETRRGTWRGHQRGRLPFSHWVDEWWSDWSADLHRSPSTLVMAESRLRHPASSASSTVLRSVAAASWTVSSASGSASSRSSPIGWPLRTDRP